MKIAGLDIGATGCKLTVFDEAGKYLGKAYRVTRSGAPELRCRLREPRSGGRRRGHGGVPDAHI